MRTILPAVLLAAAASSVSCSKSLECGVGTIEQNNECQIADEVVGSASCGPFTELQGDICVPMFPPTECDPQTTTAVTDQGTGVTTCFGNGQSQGCSGVFACPAPSTGHETFCGQIYDIENDQPFQGAATGALCTGTETSGPCALAFQAFDAIAFAGNPTGTPPLATGGVDIDDCGRFRVKDVSPPSGPFVALGLDDAGSGSAGPAGQTNAVGIALPYSANMTVANLQHFVASSTVTTQWQTTGGPGIATGVYTGIFRAHSNNSTADQAGVTLTVNANPATASYFGSNETTRDSIDTTATVTGANGTGLVGSGASILDVYTGSGGLPAGCEYDSHPGIPVPGIVFVQVFTPQSDGTGSGCPL